MINIEELNERYGIPGVARVMEGNSGLPMVRVTTQESSADIYLHGAQVTSWKPVGQEDVLFVSERSQWHEGKAIRGGIPICFPWFRAKADEAKAPAHGVVRTRVWNLERVNAAADGSVTVTFSIDSDASTRRWWAHDFFLELRVTIGKTLSLKLIATNTGSTTFRFEEALHTYFRVGDVERVVVEGLDGSKYLDNTDGNREKPQEGELKLTGPTDNAYVNATGAVELVDPAMSRKLITEKENSATTIVWNPWATGAADLADLGDEEWQPMLCIEASNILGAAVSLAPGEEHAMGATLSLVSG